MGTAGSVIDVWALFVKLFLEDCPDLLDRIEVRRVGRVFIDLNIVLHKPFSKN